MLDPEGQAEAVLEQADKAARVEPQQEDRTTAVEA